MFVVLLSVLMKALRVFNGDVVRIGDGVLLSAEENKPP